MKISARNLLKGTVKKIAHGTVNSVVVVTLPGGQDVAAMITRESAENLGLAEGKPAYAVIKASNVMIATD